jgi:hypothetical protein
MVDGPARSGHPPQFTMVIATFNDWQPLHECLRSLAEQVAALPRLFENGAADFP